MTTTYNTSGSSAPTQNADGEMVWKPSVGVVFKPAEPRAQSYGGIVGALQDEILTNGSIPKSYPHNFAGIIAAIQDLEAAGTQIPVVPGPIPPGTEIDGSTGDLIVIVPPTDGMLWFDTRQGRMFIALDEEWWQTNGADGLAYIRNPDNPPLSEEVVPGQFWFSPEDQALFIYDGNNWVLVADATVAGSFQTTATLPLAATGPRVNAPNHEGQIISNPDINNFSTQQHFNQWTFTSLVELEQELESFDPVVIGEDAPDTPRPGALWYDTESLELSIWYEDDDSGQWVPTAASYTYDEDLAVLRADIETESRVREQGLHRLQEAINAIDAADDAEVQALSSTIAALQQEVAKKAEALELLPLATSAEVEVDISELRSELLTEISAVNQSIPSLNGYATDANLASQKQELETAIGHKTTMVEVTDYVTHTLNSQSYSTQSYLDQSLATLSQNYLTHAGGTLTGSLDIRKADLAKPALDFSSSPEAGMPAFKFVTRTADYSSTYCPTFGTTEKLYELAWNFEGDEDFCWIYNDSSKVFSITKDGPACSSLVLGDIHSDTTNGRIIHNKIDVKERLSTYQTAFEAIRQGVSDASDFDELKANILSALATV